MAQNALVRLIYEAANDSLLWDAFLSKFAEVVHADTAGLLTQDKAGQWAKLARDRWHRCRVAHVL